MTTVKDLLVDKGSQVWYITPNAPLLDALKIMAEKKIGALVVIEAGRIVGIFSERDFARQVVEDPRLSVQKPVRELMTQPVYYVSPDQSADECMALMTSKHFRHLPVMENEQLIGLISIGDVIKHLIMEKEQEIKSLEDYIWVNMI